MRQIAQTTMLIKKRRIPFSNGDIQYYLDLRVGLNLPIDWINVPDEYIAAAILEELRKTVNNTDIKNIIMDDIVEFRDKEICPTCGQAVHPGE